MRHNSSKKNVAGPIYKIHLPRLEFKKMNEEIDTMISPKSNKSIFPKKLLSPTDARLKTSLDSTSLVKTFLDTKYTEQDSPSKFTSSPKTSKQVSNLFRTKTKFQDFEQITVNNQENQHETALKTGAGNALQPTKKLKFYDCFEDSHSPQEWVEICNKSDTRTHGKVPIYQEHKYFWVDVRVISYEESKKKFLVQMIETGILKYVGRLSLIFNKEDPIKFRQRIEEAKQRQYTAEDEMRFFSYVENLPTDIGSLSPDVIKRILSKIARKKRKDQEDYKQTSINNLLEYVDFLYKLHLKKFIVICDMKDPDSHKYYEERRIKLREFDEEVAYFNLYEKLDYSISNYFQKIKALHVSSKKAWIDAMKMMGKKSAQFTDFSALATNIPEKDLPLDLEDFMAKQKTAYQGSVKTVHSMWRDYLIGELQDILKNEYNFYSVAKEDYFDQEFQRFINRVDMYFNTNVREQVVNSSLHHWVRFLRRNVFPDGDKHVWQLSDKPLLILNIQLEEKSKEKKKKVVDKKKEKKDKSKEEDSDDEYDLIFFNPTIEQITEQILEPVKWVIELSNSIHKLEADLVPFLYVPRKTSFTINPEEGFVAEAISNIKAFLEYGLREPQDIINQFRKYEFLYQKEIKQTIKNIQIDSSTAQIRGELDRLTRSTREILKICPFEKNSIFFQIRTRNVKENLISKTKTLKDSILEKVSQICKERIDKISESYIEMEQRLSGDPKDEKELMTLKEEISNHAKKIAEHELEIKKVSEYLDILDDNVYPFNAEDSRKYWYLKEWPNTIKACVFDASRKADQQENKFKAKLDDEKVKFVETLESLQKDFNRVTGYAEFKDELISRYYGDVQIVQENFEKAQDTVKSFNERENMFKIPLSDYDTLNALQEAFEPFVRLWRTADDIHTKIHEWKNGRFSDLRYDPIEKTVDATYKEIGALNRLFSDKSPEAIKVLQEVKAHVDIFRVQMPLIEMLTNEAMRKKPQTWGEVFNACELDRNQFKELDDNINLAMFIEKDLLKYREKIDEIVRKTEKQWKIEKKLNEMSDKVKNTELELIFHDKSGVYLVKTVDEIQQLMDEYLNTVQSLKNSPFIKGMKIADQIEKRFLLIQDTLDNWMKVQRGWLYLEPIFSSEDIIKKLPREHRFFSEIDKKFRDLMEKVSQEKKVFDKDGEIDLERVNTDFQASNKELEKIQKALSDYLETKRRDFARFFFLSDEELLEILSETKDPTRVQPHMSKCFEAISEVEFSANQEVLAMISSEKEKVKFIKPVDVNEGDKKGNVEKWLTEVEVVMQRTLHSITKECIKDTTTRTEWVRKWPGQIILAVNQVKWTHGAETAIMRTEEYDIEGYENHLKNQLNDIIDLVRGNLSSLERLTLGALVVIDVHARDVIHELVVKAVDSVTDFEWLSQLRYYWDETMKVRMINAEMKYNFEYLGNSTRLVITPLTDRCYRTLLGAFALQYGGAPEGPAGTGKTESVKDLAKAIAIMCVVFNCSDTLNYLAMRKFFKGLVASGGWCCFDEFNRINQEVLSVIAQQVMQIQEAIKKKVKSFPFDGEENIKLVPTCAINITMNPGYAGRSELPDNLKARFRPCAMMVPDYSMISEIILYSYGFKDARNLARKIVASLKLSSEQLSTQQHYDFGMRALKAILTAAGQLKRTMKEVEDIVCMRALYDVNLPKFTMNDIPLFVGITQDLFPGVSMNPPDYSLLLGALVQVLEENKLIPEESFLKKCIQLYETIMVRHGLMMVGSTFSGKSRVVSTLERAMNILKDKDGFTGALALKLNPKSIRIEQLYGKFDPDSKAWTDGVLCILMRNCTKEIDNPQRKWLMFDGPVDAVWIENMNTVLDDNKKLCLTSGEIIKMSPQMTMMFEVEDLQHASPATVSRCGMVYLEPKNLGWEALLKSFIKKMPELFEKVKDYAQDSLRWFLDATLAFAKKFGKFPMKISEMNLAFASISLVEILLTEYIKQNNIEKLPNNFEDIIDNITLFSCIWGVGGALEEDVRPQFHTYILKLLACNDVVELFDVELNKMPFEPRAYKMKLNDPENIFDITYDIKKSNWIGWIQTVPRFTVNKDLAFHEIIVPTVESLRAAYLMKLIVSNKRHVLFTGPTGTGKTISILNELNMSYSNDDYTNLATCLSGQTQANLLQFTIEARMTTKRRKGVFGPEDRKKNLVIFIDDLNMPAKDEYGAQPPIELLRQWMDYKGWYDLDTKEFKVLEDMLFVGAMSPPSAGRNSITNRYSRHFIIQYMEPFSSHSLKAIYSSVLEWYYSGLKDAPKSIMNLKDNIISSTIELYNKIKVSKELLPTPAKSHYIYNLRDISKVFQGISKASHLSFPDSPENDFVKLWTHECLRVFQDRLINNEDRNYMHQMIKEILKNNFKREWSNLVQIEPLLWANYVPTIYPDGDKTRKRLNGIYCELTDRDEMKKASELALEDYNQYNGSANKMELVLFQTAIEHVIKIVRIISTPFGHALLVGVGGSGRKSLATLACSIVGYEIVTVEVSKNYDQKAWNEDLQRILKKCGLDLKPTVFIFTDAQIWKESILEDISSLLNNGEVPNLFPTEEKAKILDNMSEIPGQSETPNEKFQRFIAKCKEFLHLVLCLSPVGEAFRRRMRTFPSLVNCTTIDWFLPWPEEALRSVAVAILKDVALDKTNKDGVVDIFVDMQQRVTQLTVRYYQELRKYYYVTPTSYLELLATFMHILAERKRKVDEMKRRYSVGLEALYNAEKDVVKMKAELDVLTPQLKVKKEEASHMLVKINEEKKIADAERLICEAEEKQCNIQKEEAEKMRESCEEKLKKVYPILEKAKAALNAIDKNELNQVKTFNIVTPPVRITMQAVCVLKGIGPIMKKEGMENVEDWWATAKKKLLVSVDGFMKDIKSYDVKAISNIDAKIIAKLKKDFLTNPDFDEKVVMNASVSAANIAEWIRAVVSVYDAYLVVEPEQRALDLAEGALKKAEQVLADKKAKLQEVMNRLKLLEDEFEQTRVAKETLEARVEKCNFQIKSAEKLTVGLAGEKVLWRKRAEDLEVSGRSVLGDSVLSSGFVAYLGAFPLSYREECVSVWGELLDKFQIVKTPNFKLEEVLSDAIQVGNWCNKYKLPNDSISVENAIIMHNSKRSPLMIDPQVQAHKWICEMEKTEKTPNNPKAPQKLFIIKPTWTPKEYTSRVEHCLAEGYPVLLENIGESIDPIFDSILSQKIIKRGGDWKIKFGEGEVDYSPNFRLYITTKLSRPHYPPEVCVKVTLLNFTVTPEGLEDNMLNIVVNEEERLIEEKRQNNILETFRNKEKQRNTEDLILSSLANATGNILDNTVLIETLSNSKIEAQEIENKIEELKKDSVKFQQVRVQYKKVAKRVSSLFFVIADLSTIEPVYQYSLEWYVSLYYDAIKTSAPNKDSKDARCHNIIERFMLILYDNVCRSLLEKDKLLFIFLIVVKIMQAENRVLPAEVRFLLVGGTTLETVKPNPGEGWLTTKQWATIEEIVKVHPQSFANFDTEFIENIDGWKQVFDSQEPMKTPWPKKWFDKLNSIQRLIILRILRPDKVIAGIQDLVIAEMGDSHFIEGGGALDLQAVYKDSERNIINPIIFILSPGVDPLSEIFRLAEKQGGGRGNVVPLSLGQGMAQTAIANIQDGVKNGRWIVLENCHLAPSFMPELEKTIEAISEPTSSYRLWLTTMPSDTFPVSILQNGIKLTNEPPKGIRNNLMRSYKAIDIKLFDAQMKEFAKAAQYKKLMFGLSFFHAHVQERKKFGPLGWNIPYEFNSADLNISMSQLKIFLEDYEEIPWEALNYMVAEANYGGRVTDPMDRRLIKSILKDFYTPKILDDKYRFSPNPNYFAPPEGNLMDYIDYIKDLPFNETADLFGLHQNAEISSAIAETNQLLGNALSLQPRTTSAGGQSSEQIIQEKCASILSKLPAPFIIEDVAKKHPVRYEESMNTVLQQELLRYNNLLQVVTSSLKQLSKAIEGLVVMSPELEEVFNKMFDNMVPGLWHKAAYPSRKPLGSWVIDLGERLKFMQKWVDEGAPPSFWVSGFYFTQSFLTGTLQNYARKTKIPIDTLAFDFYVIKQKDDPLCNVKKSPADGCYVYGLFLDGCRWDEEQMTLEESHPKILNYVMPYIWLTPKKQDDIDKTKHIYECPVYKTSRRAGTLSTTGHSTNFVLSMLLPMSKKHDQNHWIKRGVALLTQLDD